MSEAAAQRQSQGGDSRRNRLREIVRQRSFSTGTETRLASGATSSFYFNMKPTILDPEGACLVAELMFEALPGGQVDFVGGLELGAVPLVALVARASWPARPVRAFFVRKQPKDHGTRQLIDGIGDAAELAGRRVVMLEDVSTTGGSVMKAVDAAREAGATVDTVITIVDRQEGAEASLAAQGLRLVPILRAEDFR